MESQQQCVHVTTPFMVFICNKKRVHEIFLKSKLQIMQLKLQASLLGFKNYFLIYSALQTLVPPNLCLLLRPSQVVNIFNVSFSFQCFFIKYFHKSAMHRTWALALFSKAVIHHSITDKSSSFESRCCLIFGAHNTLITDPTSVANEWKVQCKNHY